MKKLKEMFFSERGMGIVNMLFCLSLLIQARKHSQATRQR